MGGIVLMNQDSNRKKVEDKIIREVMEISKENSKRTNRKSKNAIVSEVQEIIEREINRHII